MRLDAKSGPSKPTPKWLVVRLNLSQTSSAWSLLWERNLTFPDILPIIKALTALVAPPAETPAAEKANLIPPALCSNIGRLVLRPDISQSQLELDTESPPLSDSTVSSTTRKMSSNKKTLPNKTDSLLGKDP